MFKCVFASLLFEEFVHIRGQLWSGRLWSEDFIVRTAMVVASSKIEDCINRS
jgi:REP element-mobilizing transposase RayT